MVDDFHGNAAGGRAGKGPGGVAVQAGPGLGIDLGLERGFQGLVGVVGAKKSALLLPGQIMKHFAQVSSQLRVERPATTLRDKHHMIFAHPDGVGLLVCPSGFSCIVCFGGSRRGVSWWTPGTVNRLLSPRQSRGFTQCNYSPIS